VTDKSTLVKYQQIVWYFCLAYFLLASVLLAMKNSSGYFLSHLGVKIVLAATISQLVVMSHEFRKTGNRKFAALSLILLLVIVASSAIGSILL